MAPNIRKLWKRQAEPVAAEAAAADDAAIETTTLHLEHFNKHHRHHLTTPETLGKSGVPLHREVRLRLQPEVNVCLYRASVSVLCVLVVV